jgi:intracellular septation protein A
VKLWWFVIPATAVLVVAAIVGEGLTWLKHRRIDKRQGS